MFSPSVLWPSLTFIMNYQLCMTHYLATANHHDHAWTGKWAPNISTLSRQMSLMRLWCDHQDLGWRGHLYETKGTWKNSPTCCALLNVGFMAILRRTDCFILIWTCNAVLAVSHHCHFSKLPPIQKQNPQKQERSFVLLPCCPRTMLRNDACEAVW